MMKETVRYSISWILWEMKLERMFQKQLFSRVSRVIIIISIGSSNQNNNITKLSLNLNLRWCFRLAGVLGIHRWQLSLYLFWEDWVSSHIYCVLCSVQIFRCSSRCKYYEEVRYNQLLVALSYTLLFKEREILNLNTSPSSCWSYRLVSISPWEEKGRKRMRRNEQPMTSRNTLSHETETLNIFFLTRRWKAISSYLRTSTITMN